MADNGLPKDGITWQEWWNTLEGQDARGVLMAAFKSYGLGSLAGKIDTFIQQGMSSSEMTLQLKQTAEYKKRFAAMDTLSKKGRALSEGEYIRMEQGYAQVLKEAGLPKGFYDKPEDFTKFLANDISVSEVAERAKTARNIVNSRDPNLLAAFKEYYGINKGALTAYYLDPSRAKPILDQMAQGAYIGAEGKGQGLDISGKTATMLGEKVSPEGARQAFGQVAEHKAGLEGLAGIDQVNISDDLLAKAATGVSASAEAKVRGLASRERARFSGRGGGTGALDQGTAGSF